LENEKAIVIEIDAAATQEGRHFLVCYFFIIDLFRYYIIE
jgi:hypothetical protein